MKNLNLLTIFNGRIGVFVAVLLSALPAVSVRADDDAPKVIIKAGADDTDGPSGPITHGQIFIHRDRANRNPRNEETTWLGVAVTESAEALTAQLSLKPGQGLVVIMVASNSPAAAVGIQRNDVLVDLDGQMLVDPAQLPKLVQMHGAGDNVKLTFYHAGSKHTVDVKLTKHLAGEDLEGGGGGNGDIQNFHFNLPALSNLPGLDNGQLSGEVQQAMDQAQQAVQLALRESLNGTDGLNHKLEIIQKKLGNLADGGVNVGKDSTVVVKNEADAVRTMVKKDEAGTYVIVADPARHLTVHDSSSKLLFDGLIDTPDQQAKVPKGIWAKVQPMMDQLEQGPDGDKHSSQSDSSDK